MVVSATMLDEEVDEDCELEDRKERGSIEYLNWEGDGIFDSIYEVLWTRIEGSAVEIVVPDTIVFRFNKLTAWYYTKFGKGKAPRLHKKRSSALRLNLLLKHFQRLSQHNSSDIVAYFITQEALENDTQGSTICYLTKSELPHFLLHTGNKNGILQRFIDPKHSTNMVLSNCMVRSTWSSSVCLIERRSSIHPLTNTKLSRYARAETFEGDFRNSNEYPLTSATLLEEIEDACRVIVNHFAEAACGKIGISRMVVNFKFDSDTQLHFLWCESLRLTTKRHPLTGAPLAPPPSVIGGGQSFDLGNKLKLPLPAEQGEKFRACAICDVEFCVADLVSTPYHTMLAAFDEIKLSGLEGQSAEKLRLRLNRAPPRKRQNAGGEVHCTVPIDSQSFTQKHNNKQGLLANVDDRLLLRDPMGALEQAIKEWEEREEREKGV
eukprot:Sspe_Gene.92200::Locus_64053_Transcript_1_1_Confidence_1.000_Length_1364::g.92200::m.92200